MAEEKDLQAARKVFATMCSTLDGHDWKYEKDTDNLTIDCTAQGDDLPMDITIRVDPDKHIVLLFSRLPYTVAEDKRLDVAVAVSVVNNNLVDGSFDYDIKSGRLYFRMTTSFLESSIGSDAFTYMLFCSCQIIDEYNDKFLMIAKNMLSLEQFIAKN